MNTKNLFLTVSSFLLVVLLSSCGPKVNTETGDINLEVKNVVGDQSLILSTGVYTNAAGHQFSVNTFKYYISNIQLRKEDGSLFTYPKDESYFLINELDAASKIVSLQDIPAGDYKQLIFVLGVDSTKNYAPAAEHTGTLDPGEGMYWTWSSGHIFWKLEGSSPDINNSGSDKFAYHIAGAGGIPSALTINNVKTITIDFGTEKLSVADGSKPEVHIKADILKIFNGDLPFSIVDYPMVTDLSKESGTLAKNAANMFSFDKIH
ncbi:MAG: hypothetical protein K1X92_06360 [Bacteroidia bacterium]|nr:hypothetical protein [Bacteroidia bacterium]